ncbi:hypothetical protein M8C21_007689 [Ambrosia artemisiifolia]|uniref:Uncharacterized protein n=1 Tax=Ambrosia artemisiifolia TaxID=4212 RepID=A0AAD5BQ81_AMBAR|nr:hypothetical protein M8C21_007689 [Ambrosia artemisiifolia]
MLRIKEEEDEGGFSRWCGRDCLRSRLGSKFSDEVEFCGTMGFLLVYWLWVMENTGILTLQPKGNEPSLEMRVVRKEVASRKWSRESTDQQWTQNCASTHAIKYKPPKASDRAQVESKEVKLPDSGLIPLDDQDVEIALKLSDDLHLNEIDCVRLLASANQEAIVLDQGLKADLQADVLKYVEDLINSELRQRLISLIKLRIKLVALIASQNDKYCMPTNRQLKPKQYMLRVLGHEDVMKMVASP